MAWLNFLFSTSGRLNRSKYWLFALGYSVVYLVVLLTVAVTMLPAIRTGSSIGTAATLLFLLFYLVSLIPYVTVSVRRLHDREKSGTWVIAFLVVPTVANTLIRRNDEIAVAEIIVALLAVALSIWGFVELGCLKGTTGPNEFGPDPLEKPTATAAVFE
jgi:uncharacterized membrane protein YhaH (DUF805 family)